MPLDNFSPNNPNRVTDWRWQLGQYCVEHQLRLSRRQDDAWVRKSRRFIRRLRGCHNDGDYLRLEWDQPDIYWAHRVYGSRLKSDRNLRCELEARLLARQTDDEIEGYCCLTKAAIAAFEKLFFNVRPRLEKPSYVVHVAVGDAMHDGLSATDYPELWRLFGYFGGPTLVDLMVQTFARPYKLGVEIDVMAFARDATRDDLVRSAMIAAKTMSINRLNQQFIVELFLKLRELEQGGDDSERDASTGHLVQELVTAVQQSWRLSGKTKHRLPMCFPGSGAQRRTSDLLALQAGMETTEDATIVSVQ